MQTSTGPQRAKMTPPWRKFFVYLWALFLAGLLSGCVSSLKPQVSLAPEELLSHEDEQMLWRKSEQEQRAFERNGLIYADAKLEDYLNQVVASLKPESVPPVLTMRVKVIKNPYLNAFAYPNGMIYIHSGLLARMQNEDQLATVLAHEMAHAIQRHALRAFRTYKNQPALIIALQQTLLKTEGLRQLARSMGMTGVMAAISGYARELEAEADRLGYEWAARAGYNPKETLLLFDHLMTESEQAGFEEPFFFASHPKIRQRIAHLQKLTEPAMINIQPPGKSRDMFFLKLDRLFLDNARMDIRLGRFDAARRSVEKSLYIKPDEKRAFFLLGEIYRQRGQDSDEREALKYYNRAIALDPNFVAPHKAIGLIHFKKGQHARAKKFFESCLQLAPNSPDKAYIEGYLRQYKISEEG